MVYVCFIVLAARCYVVDDCGQVRSKPKRIRRTEWTRKWETHTCISHLQHFFCGTCIRPIFISCCFCLFCLFFVCFVLFLYVCLLLVVLLLFFVVCLFVLFLISVVKWTMFYLTTHFIYGYMASDLRLRTSLVARRTIRSQLFMSCSFQLAARDL